MKKEKIDFIGIGAAKSGSSWIGACLSEHPQINLPKDKSLFFFNAEYGNEYKKDNWTNYHKGMDWYIERFAPKEKDKIRGEFGVSYLNDPIACKRIKKHFPDTKILVTLRNPVDMVYSLYWYADSTVEIKVPETFEKAVDEGFYLDRGKYYKHLHRYFKEFPKKNIHVVVFDDIKDKPDKVVKDLYKFLEVDESFKPSMLNKRVYSSIGHKSQAFKKVGFYLFAALEKLGLERVRRFIIDNRIFYAIYAKLNVRPTKYPKMSSKTREKLIKYYLSGNEKLEKLIDRNLNSWKK